MHLSPQTSRFQVDAGAKGLGRSGRDSAEAARQGIGPDPIQAVSVRVDSDGGAAGLSARIMEARHDECYESRSSNSQLCTVHRAKGSS